MTGVDAEGNFNTAPTPAYPEEMCAWIADIILADWYSRVASPEVGEIATAKAGQTARVFERRVPLVEAEATTTATTRTMRSVHLSTALIFIVDTDDEQAEQDQPHTEPGGRLRHHGRARGGSGVRHGGHGEEPG